MGVNHLFRDANMASGNAASTNELAGSAPDSRLHSNTSSGILPKQVSPTTNMPQVNDVQALSKAALRPRVALAPHRNGGTQTAGARGKHGSHAFGDPSGNTPFRTGGQAGRS